MQFSPKFMKTFFKRIDKKDYCGIVDMLVHYSGLIELEPVFFEDKDNKMEMDKIVETLSEESKTMIKFNYPQMF